MNKAKLTKTMYPCPDCEKLHNYPDDARECCAGWVDSVDAVECRYCGTWNEFEDWTCSKCKKPLDEQPDEACPHCDSDNIKEFIGRSRVNNYAACMNCGALLDSQTPINAFDKEAFLTNVKRTGKLIYV